MAHIRIFVLLLLFAVTLSYVRPQPFGAIAGKGPRAPRGNPSSTDPSSSTSDSSGSTSDSSGSTSDPSGSTSETTSETLDSTSEPPSTTPDGAGLAYASVITLTALCVVAIVL